MKKTFTSIALTLSCLCGFATANANAAEPSVTVKGMEFIDMGTSVKWASQPLGISDTWPCGALYKFGAIDPFPEVSNLNLFGMNDTEWGGNVKFDAATAAYGNGVLTPSKALFEELIAVCDITFGYNYDIRHYVMTLTSKTTGNKITITGAGSGSYDNFHPDAADVCLYTSTGVIGDTKDGYYLSGQASLSLGKDQAIRLQKDASAYAYQVLPVYDASKVVKAESITLNTTELSMATGDKKPLTATVAPEGTSNKELAWTSSDESVATVNKNGEVEATGEGECTITVSTTDGSELSASCTVTVVAPNTGMKFVDLGISLLWGEHEIGATSYNEAGTYYAWGTVENANNYQAATAASYPVVPDGPCTGVARDASNPTKAYDVATEVLGSNWHTPTRAEWQELFDNCTMTRETIGGQKVTCLVSKINGNKIYFRGFGYLKDTSSTPLMKTDMIFQTSDAPTGDIYKAVNIMNPSVYDLPRQCYWMVTIRPVCTKSDASIGNITADSKYDGVYDVYDISGRFVTGGIEYNDAKNRLTKGIYIFVGSEGRRFKVAI